jgi:DNA-binding transcriptional MerR regulator/methylmalonyl-CoA mutase cobalamin-binding subunit
MSNAGITIVAMEDREIYTIRYVSIRTGLKPHVLRAWEKRYDAVCPRRNETNRRLYSNSDIRRLQLLRRAVQSGHSISQVAALGDNELEGLNHAAAPLEAASDAGDPSTRIIDDTRQIVIDALEKIRNFDQVSLEHVLKRAAVNLTRSRFLGSVIQPLFHEIGELWASGDLKIINERMATIVTRSLLLDMLNSVTVAKTAPQIVVAAPVGQWHETGAIAVALITAESGWRPLYFGPNLPAEEIAAAAQITESKVIALSISHQIDNMLVLREIRKLRSYCADKVRIFVGGQGIFELKAHINPFGVRCIESVDELKSELET